MDDDFDDALRHAKAAREAVELGHRKLMKMIEDNIARTAAARPFEDVRETLARIERLLIEQRNLLRDLRKQAGQGIGDESKE